MKVTKWSIHPGELAVSEQAEQISGEPGSSLAEPIAAKPAEAVTEPTAAKPEAPADTPSPSLAPEQGGAAEAAAAKPAETAGPSAAGKLMIMAPGEKWAGDDASREAKAAAPSGLFGKRRLATMAAVVALAAIAGALGGAMATVRLRQLSGDAASSAGNHALEASVARIDADLSALKASVEHASKMSMSQFNKTSDRLDKLEKAQAEPAAKLARLSEAVEKLHASPAPAPAAATAPQGAAKDVTGSVTAAAPAAPKVEVARLPTIDGWILRDVGHGGALIEGRRGVYEVYAGDPVPGLGRIDAIRRQDGRWVVVTSRGLIVER
jgi:hypothetical protein